MKILILQDDFPPVAQGGAGKIVATISAGYVAAGHEVVVVTTVQDKAAAGSFVEGGMRIERIYSNYHARWRAWRCLYNPGAVGRVKELLALYKPDVVHVHNVHQNISYYSLVLAKRSGAKVFLTAHDVQAFNYSKLFNYTSYCVSAWRQFKEEKFRYNPFRNMAIRHVLRTHVDGVIAVSYALKEALEANDITVKAVVHNGIDTTEWAAPADAVAEFKNKHGVGSHAVLFSGGSYLKGTKQILDAFALVHSQVPSAQLLVVGRNTPTGGGVVQAGWLAHEALQAAYGAAAAVVVPSICFDSFPTINLEAMAAGKPVVATTLGGSREAVGDGKTGYIVDPFDTQMLAAKLIELLNDEAKAKAMGEAGRERVRKEFTIAAQIQNYLNIFNGQ